MNTFDVLTIGDVSMDAFVAPEEAQSYCSIDDKESLICFKFGDKIPVKNFTLCPGGNAANNAVGLSRLGLKTSLVSTLGGGNIGTLLLTKLQSEGVDLTYAIQQMQARTNYSTILSFAGERTIFSYHAPRSYEFPINLPETPWIYLTSMGESFRPFYNHLLEWLTKFPNVKVAFNPGSRQIRSLSDIESVWPRSTVVYVNKDEAQTITGYSGEDMKELLTQLSQKGPEISIITDGSRGAFMYDKKRFLHVGVIPVDAFERTGAGDAFGSACLAAIIQGKPMEEALMYGTINAASVIGYVGAHEGLLHPEETAVWLERAKSANVSAVEF